MQSVDNMIEVLQAYKDGKKIEFKRGGKIEWEDITDPRWDFSYGEYRVKKEPMVKWVAIDESQDIIFSNSNPYMVNAWIKNQKGLYRTVKLVEDIEHEPQ